MEREGVMTVFEEISDKTMGDFDPNNMMENCIYWLQGDKTVTVNFCGYNRYASKIRKLAEEHPDEVKISSDKNQALVATLPLKYIKIYAPPTMSEERRMAASERLRAFRESHEGHQGETI